MSPRSTAWLSLTLLAGCGRPAPTRQAGAGSTAGGTVIASPATTTRDTDTTRAPIRDSTTTARPDSAPPIAEAAQLKARTFRDSFSLVAAVRRGLKSDGWPVRGPAPLAGALLPGRR